MRQPAPRRDVAMMIGMILSIAAPALVTLATVRAAPHTMALEDNPSPYGYTVSLLMFFLPVLLIGIWHLWHPGHVVHRRALIGSTLAIAVIGVVLDVVFGYTFFTFRNTGATLGIRLPAWDLAGMRWVPSYLPIEEFGFYIFGALFVIAVYVWADSNWLADYSTEEYQMAARAQPRLVRMSTAAGVSLVLIVLAGLAFKRFGPHEHTDGLPGYFLFIMVLGFLPTFLLLRGVAPFINWRAFGFTYPILVLISVVWEVTLGVPYEWWNFHPEQMLGIRFLAWSNLPVEEILLWLVIAWDCILVYETFRVIGHMDRPVMEALFGRRAA